jgi:hypothetical protein
MKHNKIIILGGGSAGWMTAATLIKAFPKKDITVIESPNIKTVGVGESTLGSINDWLEFLDIEDKDFMPHTKASYKLSIRFEDFYKKGDKGFHYPFGNVFENNEVGLKQSWFYKKKFNPKIKLSDYAKSISPQMAMVNNNVMFKNEDNELPGFSFKYHVAYHFDAAKFGEWLREFYCKPKGVKHIQEEIKTIETNDDGIKSLNKKHIADLFIDCTGFKSLLLDKTLQEPFRDYTKLLPNNKAWATSVKYKNKEKQLEPYTNCTAIENGWVWNIPSWDKIGTGYVYSDKYVSDEKALEQLKKHLTKKGLDYSKSTFNNIKMRVGIHERIFVKNVCAIGLSAGFIEPLESNGLLSVHVFLMNLVKILKRDVLTQFIKDNFNIGCRKFFDGFVEFVAAHYAFSCRKDTPYWRDIAKKSFYDNRIADNELESTMECYMDELCYLNSRSGYHYIATGMNYFSMDINHKEMPPNVDMFLKKREKEIKRWNEVCKGKPSLLKFLKTNIYNKTSK